MNYAAVITDPLWQEAFPLTADWFTLRWHHVDGAAQRFNYASVCAASSFSLRYPFSWLFRSRRSRLNIYVRHKTFSFLLPESRVHCGASVCVRSRDARSIYWHVRERVWRNKPNGTAVSDWLFCCDWRRRDCFDDGMKGQVGHRCSTCSSALLIETDQ